MRDATGVSTTSAGGGDEKGKKYVGRGREGGRAGGDITRRGEAAEQP